MSVSRIRKHLDSVNKMCYQHSYTYRGINSVLDAAKMKQDLEQSQSYKVDVEIGFDNMTYEGWVKLTWFEPIEN